MRWAWTIFAFAILATGCATPDKPGPPAGETWPPQALRMTSQSTYAANIATVMHECQQPLLGPLLIDRCREPTVTWDGTWHFHVTAYGGSLSRSLDGIVWEPISPPPLPTGAGPLLDDGWITVDASSRLWWSALSRPSEDVVVARSDDHGLTWPLVTALGLVGEPTLPSASDRQWLSFAPDGRILLTCTCPSLGPPLLAWSSDDGETWVTESAIPWIGHRNPLGRPLFLDDGTLVAPFIQGNLADTESPRVVVGVMHAGSNAEVVSVTGPSDDLQSGYWPEVTVDATGVLWIAWSEAGSAKLAHSRDATTWSDPMSVPGLGTVQGPHPGLRAWNDGLALAVFSDRGQELALIDPSGAVTIMSVGTAGVPDTDYVDVLIAGDAVIVPWNRQETSGVTAYRRAS